MRVLYFGTYRAAYSRNRTMIAGLRRNHVQVIECHEPLWRGIEDRVQTVSGGWKRPEFWLRFVRAYARLLQRYWPLRNDYDVMLVGYPGQADVFLGRLLSWLQRKPLAWDIFMSIYLIALERGLEAKNRTAVKLLRRLEKVACRLPDLLIIDTEPYARWFERTHGISARRFRLVPTGTDDTLFTPRREPARTDSTFRVLYYGTYIPNHGVHHIVDAAALLADDPTIFFEMIGDGPERAAAIHAAEHNGTGNMAFVDWLDQGALADHIAQADLCLGAFGVTPQSLMTVQNKIYECLAMAKPVLTGDSLAVRQALAHGEEVYLCERANAQALADAIRLLRASPEVCERIGRGGYAAVQKRYTAAMLGEALAGCLSKLSA
jgi:glycosyltransferase involved in cell wall biosynthesis